MGLDTYVPGRREPLSARWARIGAIFNPPQDLWSVRDPSMLCPRAPLPRVAQLRRCGLRATPEQPLTMVTRAWQAQIRAMRFPLISVLAILFVVRSLPACSSDADPGPDGSGGIAGSSDGGSGGAGSLGEGAEPAAEAGRTTASGGSHAGSGGTTASAPKGCTSPKAATAIDPNGAVACQGTAIVRCDNGTWKEVVDCGPKRDSGGVYCHCGGGAEYKATTQCETPYEACGTSYVSCPKGFPCAMSTLPRADPAKCDQCLSACRGLPGCCTGEGCICESSC